MLAGTCLGAFVFPAGGAVLEVPGMWGKELSLKSCLTKLGGELLLVFANLQNKPF